MNDTMYEADSKIKFSGEYRLYYPGDLKIFGQYMAGLKEGEFKYFNDAKYLVNPSSAYFGRKLDSIVTFKKGKRNGLKKIYHNSFNAPYIISIENFSNDQLNGESNYWDFSGQPLSTNEYENGKIKKHIKYQIDTTIQLIDYRIMEFPNDTIDFKQYKLNDPLKIELIAYTTSDSLIKFTNKGYRIKSINISRIDQSQTFNSDSFLLRNKPDYQGEVRIWITYVTIIDPNNKEYSLPTRTIMLKNAK